MAEIIALAGLSLVLSPASLGILTFFLLIADLLISVMEERELEERFGDAYRTYKRKTPRLIPRLKRQI